MTVFYTLKDVSDTLKKNKLPASRPTLNQLEKKGIIPKSKNSVHFKRKSRGKISLSEMRIYSQDEISDIVNKLQDHFRA